MSDIGRLGERSLHAALKDRIAQPGDRFEVDIDGYVIDLVRGDLLIEIQTRGFANIKRKLAALLDEHRVHLVHPVPAARWIVKMDGDKRLSRRKSPKRAGVRDLFRELVYIPHLLAHANFTLEVLLVHEEEIRHNDGKGSWRRKGWSITDRRLLEVVAAHVFTTPGDLLPLLPPEMPEAFTTQDLARGLGIPRRTAQQMAYCLREMQLIHRTGKRGNALVYAVVPSPSG